MTENKYHKGKIYTLRSNQTNLYYIGSTTQELYKRLHEHKTHYKSFNNQKQHYISSYEIVKHNDAYIELLEEFKCENKMELNKREGELIRQYKDVIVNMFIPNRTVEEYREDNKDKLKLQNQEYDRTHRKERTDAHREYLKLNKDKINKQRRDNYKKKKEDAKI
jgi:hypothetical protein